MTSAPSFKKTKPSSRPRIRNSFSRDRRRAPKVAPDPLQEILDRYVDPDRMDVRDCRTVHRLPSSRSRRFAERRPGSIGHITLRGKFEPRLFRDDHVVLRARAQLVRPCLARDRVDLSPQRLSPRMGTRCRAYRPRSHRVLSIRPRTDTSATAHPRGLPMETGPAQCQ